MNKIVISALDVTLQLLGPGESVGNHVGLQPTGFDLVPLDKVALVINAPGVEVAIIGTPQQLRERVEDGLNLPVPAGVSLFDE